MRKSPAEFLAEIGPQALNSRWGARCLEFCVRFSRRPREQKKCTGRGQSLEGKPDTSGFSPSRFLSVVAMVDGDDGDVQGLYILA